VVAAPLDVRPPVSAEVVARRRLPAFDVGGRPVHGHVRYYCIDDAKGRPIGLGITYGWETADDVVRELDIALPEVRKSGALVVLEALTRLIDAALQCEDVLEMRGRVRLGGGARGYARLYGAVGAREVGRHTQLDPRSGERVGRVLYAATPDVFYASVAARRYGCTAPQGLK